MDGWMDFIIFLDDYLLADDDPLMTAALNYKPLAGSSVASQNKSMGGTQSSAFKRDQSFEATSNMFHP